MKYVVYKQTYRERVRWYARPLAEGGREDYSYFFEGEEAKLLADQKARELNELERSFSDSPNTIRQGQE
jgi:hypothetical protein